MNEKSTREILEGNIVFYKLKPRDRPTDPQKLWKGKVKKYIPVHPNPNISVVIVEVLDQGCDGCEEYLTADQIAYVGEEKRERDA